MRYSWPDRIFVYQQSWVEVPRNVGSCLQTGFLNSFGTAKVKTRRPPVRARLKTRGISKTSQVCHTCNRTAQHPVVKRPAVRLRNVPLMVFRVGQVNSGHSPLRGVVHTFMGVPRGKWNSEVPHIRSRRQRTDIAKYSFVNRTIQDWNQLPAEVLGTLPCKLKTLKKRVRKAIIQMS